MSIRVINQKLLNKVLKYHPSANPFKTLPKDLKKLSSILINFLIAENEKTLEVGVKQYNNIIPKETSILANTKKIGFAQNIKPSTHTEHNKWVYNNKPDYFDKKVRIYVKETNQMHNEGNFWAIQFERRAVYKTPAMGWTHVNDSQTKRNMFFNSLEEAISYCLEMGLSYEVSYPRYRYLLKKSYADNFKWKGFPQKDEDEEH